MYCASGRNIAEVFTKETEGSAVWGNVRSSVRASLTAVSTAFLAACATPGYVLTDYGPYPPPYPEAVPVTPSFSTGGYEATPKTEYGTAEAGYQQPSLVHRLIWMGDVVFDLSRGYCQFELFGDGGRQGCLGAPAVLGAPPYKVHEPAVQKHLYKADPALER